MPQMIKSEHKEIMIVKDSFKENSKNFKTNKENNKDNSKWKLKKERKLWS